MDQLTYYQENGIRVLEEEERAQLFAMRAYIAKTSAEMATRILIILGGNSVYKDQHQKDLFVTSLQLLHIHTHLYEDAMVGYGKSILGFNGHPMW